MEDGNIDLQLAVEADQRTETHRRRQNLLEIGSRILDHILVRHSDLTEFTITEQEIEQLTGTSDYRETNAVLNDAVRAVDKACDRARLAAKTSEEYATLVRDQLGHDTATEDSFAGVEDGGLAGS